MLDTFEFAMECCEQDILMEVNDTGRWTNTLKRSAQRSLGDLEYHAGKADEYGRRRYKIYHSGKRYKDGGGNASILTRKQNTHLDAAYVAGGKLRRANRALRKAGQDEVNPQYNPYSSTARDAMR